MNIDHTFLLSAGLGTRMGEIGTKFPKPLWPIFNHSILDTEYLFWADKVRSNFYFNSHHCRDVLVKNIEYKNELKELYEGDLLHVGGAVYNFTSCVSNQGTMLMINADQFLHFDNEILESGLEKLKSHPVVLFGIKVKSGQGYNETILKDGLLTEIDKEPTAKTFLTYSGVALINLDELNYLPGPQNFFNTIADYKSKDVYMIEVNDYEYMDFGTLERYASSLHELHFTDSQIKECFKRLGVMSDNQYRFDKYGINVEIFDEIVKVSDGTVNETVSLGLV